MNCLGCASKECKTKGNDCTGEKDKIIPQYRHFQEEYRSADNLVAGGRAGTLSRLEEIIEYAQSLEYRHITLAYCFSMEAFSKQVQERFRRSGFTTSSYRCTVGGLKESDIVPELKDSVNCNPIGQAHAINNSTADLVIEIGLCLGHDIIFHRHIEKPFTVLIIKDRKHNHIPQKELEQIRGKVENSAYGCR